MKTSLFSLYLNPSYSRINKVQVPWESRFKKSGDNAYTTSNQVSLVNSKGTKLLSLSNSIDSLSERWKNRLLTHLCLSFLMRIVNKLFAAFYGNGLEKSKGPLSTRPTSSRFILTRRQTAHKRKQLYDIHSWEHHQIPVAALAKKSGKTG